MEARRERGKVGVERMPRDVKETIVSYLSPVEISHLQQTSRLLHSDISLARRVWPPSRVYPMTRSFRRGSEHGGISKMCFGVVVPEYSDQYHSISLKCDWFDDSWTEQQAQLYIVSHSKVRGSTASDCAEAASMLPFDRGVVVVKSPLIRFYKTTTTLSFVPKQYRVYQLWCHLGHGSHHAINLENIQIQGLSYGGKQPNFEVYCPKIPINFEENTVQVRNFTFRAPSVLDDQSFLYPDFKIA